MHRNLFIAIAALFVAAPPTTDSANAHEPRRFVIEVTAGAAGAEQAFRGAIGYRGRVELIESTTPFRKEISAASFTVMFEATDAAGVVLATAYGEQDGKLTQLGNVSGRSGKITEEPWHDCVSRSFGGI